MSLSSTLRRALEARTRRPQDAAAEALGLHYAALMDRSAPAARYRKALRTLAAALQRYRGDDREDALEALDLLTVALGQHTVASDLGPKYAAILTALGLDGRPAAGQEQPLEQQQPDPLDELKERRTARNAAR